MSNGPVSGYPHLASPSLTLARFYVADCSAGVPGVSSYSTPADIASVIFASPTFTGATTTAALTGTVLTATNSNVSPVYATAAAAAGPAGSMYFNTVGGLSLYGKTGSSWDWSLYNGAGATVMYNLTATTTVGFAGALTTVGTITSGGAVILNGSGGFVTGSIAKAANSGLSIWPIAGSSYDFSIVNAANSAYALVIPTGTSNILIPTGSLTVNSAVVTQNTSAATGVTNLCQNSGTSTTGYSTFQLANSAHNVFSVLTSTAFATALLTNGSSGEVFAIYTANAIPINLGTNGTNALTLDTSQGATFAAKVVSTGQGGVGYAAGAGGTVNQATNRTTAVALNKICGDITLVSAAGSATAATFTVNNTTVAATDSVRVFQKSGTNLYNTIITAIGASSFNITFYTTGGTATDAPVFHFDVSKSANS